MKILEGQVSSTKEKNQRLEELVARNKEELTELEREVIVLRAQASLHEKRFAQPEYGPSTLAEGQLHALREQICVLMARNQQMAEEHYKKLTRLQKDVQTLKDKCHGLQTDVSQSKQQVCQLREFKTKAFKLASLGIALTKCGPVLGIFIQAYCEILDVDLGEPNAKIRIPSTRTVRHIIGEAHVASNLQNAVELLKSEGFTTGGDGTTNKAQNFDAFHYNILLLSEDGSSTTTQHVRFANLQLAPNHQSETQVQEELTYMDKIVDQFNRSPLATQPGGPELPLSTSFLAIKYHGTHGDHAEDQKAKHHLLGSWKQEMMLQGLGAKYLYSRPVNERYMLVLEARGDVIHGLGGEMAWESLSEEAKKEKDLEMMNELSNKNNDAVLMLAESEEFQELRDVENEDSDGTRKETAAEKRARELSVGEGMKTGFLLGLLLNSTDDKIGYHHIFCDYSIVHLGHGVNYPQTTNTRYSSYLDAAEETLAHLAFYIGFMKYIEFSKKNPGLNHMESNVLKVLTDPPMLTELACLALYREAVSIPYITSVYGTGLEDISALELGPILQKVKSHINKLIDDPMIILLPDSSPQASTLSRNEAWDRPDAINELKNKASRIEAMLDALDKNYDLICEAAKSGDMESLGGGLGRSRMPLRQIQVPNC
ncbi:hypothetical protein ACEPAI_3255 [Sanghuangporus weigelae]